jgi:hypothetical protein
MSSKTVILAFGLGIPAGGCLMRSTTAVENRAVKGVLAGLKAGQPVVLKDLGNAYEVTTMGGEKTGFQIVEVGGDYLVVKDEVGMVETRVPVTSIKAVVRITAGVR